MPIKLRFLKYCFDSVNMRTLTQVCFRHLEIFADSKAETYQLSQLINTPTRVSATSSTLIDLVFTNGPDKNVSSGVLHSGLSDHYPVYFVWKTSASFPRSHKYVTSRNYSKFDSFQFRKELSKLYLWISPLRTQEKTSSELILIIRLLNLSSRTLKPMNVAFTTWKLYSTFFIISKSIGQRINQSVSQPINQSINGSIDQSIN